MLGFALGTPEPSSTGQTLPACSISPARLSAMGLGPTSNKLRREKQPEPNPVHTYRSGGADEVYAQGSAVYHCPGPHQPANREQRRLISYNPLSYYQDTVNYGLSYEWDRVSMVRSFGGVSTTTIGTYALNAANLSLSRPKSRTEYLESSPRAGRVQNQQVRASSTVRLIWDFDPVHAPAGTLGERLFYYCDGHVDY